MSSISSARRLQLLTIGVAALLGSPAGGSAQSATTTTDVEASAHAAPGSEVGFASVDAATVRVLVFEKVDVESVQGPSGPIPVAHLPGGHGTGFVVNPDGVIVTAHHVVEDARVVLVIPPGDTSHARIARVVATRRDDDLALLALDERLPGIEVAPDAHLDVRQTVFALGYPIDAHRRTPQSSRGIVSGQLDDGRIQLDMALNPGNSGGPVIDEQNRVVGVVSMGGDVRAGVQGIGVAVPPNAIRALLTGPRSGDAPSADDRQAAEDIDRIVDAMVTAHVDELLEREADDRLSRVEVDTDVMIRELSMTSSTLGMAIGSAMLWNIGLLLAVDEQGKFDYSGLASAEKQRVLGMLNAASDLASRALALDPGARQAHPFLEVAASRTLQSSLGYRLLSAATRSRSRPIRGSLLQRRFEGFVVGSLSVPLANPSSNWSGSGVGGSGEAGATAWLTMGPATRLGVSLAARMTGATHFATGANDPRFGPSCETYNAEYCTWSYYGGGALIGLTARFGYRLHLTAGMTLSKYHVASELGSMIAGSGVPPVGIIAPKTVGGTFSLRFHSYPRARVGVIWGFGGTILGNGLWSVEAVQVGLWL